MGKNKTYMGLPIYQALIDSEETGVYCVSLVTNPATEIDFVYFDKDKQIEKFSVADEKEHIVAGVIMVANQPIYRRTPDGYEYYINYSKETLKQMAEKMIFNGVGSSVNIQHKDGSNVEGVNLMQLFIIDKEKGIEPNYFSQEVPDGSLIGIYKVHNDEVWDMIEKGEVLSFSLEGIFDIVPDEYKEEQQEFNEIMELINKINNKLK